MKANELRINNYVENHYLSGTPKKVTGVQLELGTDLVYVDDLSFPIINIEQVKPIPLTEEWLLKFGFSIDNPDNTYYKIVDEYLTIHIDSDDFSLRLSSEAWNEEVTPNTEVKYVHQLQNLYFALTGEELKLKEDE